MRGLVAKKWRSAGLFPLVAVCMNGPLGAQHKEGASGGVDSCPLDEEESRRPGLSSCSPVELSSFPELTIGEFTGEYDLEWSHIEHNLLNRATIDDEDTPDWEASRVPLSARDCYRLGEISAGLWAGEEEGRHRREFLEAVAKRLNMDPKNPLRLVVLCVLPNGQLKSSTFGGQRGDRYASNTRVLKLDLQQSTCEELVLKQADDQSGLWTEYDVRLLLDAFGGKEAQKARQSLTQFTEKVTSDQSAREYLQDKLVKNFPPMVWKLLQSFETKYTMEIKSFDSDSYPPPPSRPKYLTGNNSTPESEANTLEWGFRYFDEDSEEMAPPGLDDCLQRILNHFSDDETLAVESKIVADSRFGSLIKLEDFVNPFNDFSRHLMMMILTTEALGAKTHLVHFSRDRTTISTFHPPNASAEAETALVFVGGDSPRIHIFEMKQMKKQNPEGFLTPEEAKKLKEDALIFIEDRVRRARATTVRD